jgi:hypothetical protein
MDTFEMFACLGIGILIGALMGGCMEKDVMERRAIAKGCGIYQTVDGEEKFMWIEKKQ